MKALILKDKVQPGGERAKLYYEDVPKPVPDTDGVLIKLQAAAINRRDIFIRYGMYPGIEVPAIPGADGAGIIVAVGKAVTQLTIGDEVIIDPSLNWGDNLNHPSKAYKVLGVPDDGTYAQYVKVPAQNVYHKPSYLSWAEAAALPLGGITAYRAVVYKGSIGKGDTVIIPGIGGGVATIVLQIAVALGAKVFVTSSQQEKIDKAKELGATGGILYTSTDWVESMKELTGGADVVIDSIGGNIFPHLVNLCKQGGKIVSYGATLGPTPNLNMAKVFLKQLTIAGSMMGSPTQFEEMLRFFEKHKIRPIIDKSFPLEQIDQAHSYMEKGKQFGKIVLSIS